MTLTYVRLAVEHGHKLPAHKLREMAAQRVHSIEGVEACELMEPEPGLRADAAAAVMRLRKALFADEPNSRGSALLATAAAACLAVPPVHPIVASKARVSFMHGDHVIALDHPGLDRCDPVAVVSCALKLARDVKGRDVAPGAPQTVSVQEWGPTGLRVTAHWGPLPLVQFLEYVK